MLVESFLLQTINFPCVRRAEWVCVAWQGLVVARGAELLAAPAAPGFDTPGDVMHGC